MMYKIVHTPIPNENLIVQKCPFCVKKFLSSAFLQYHIEKRHQGLPTPPKPPIPEYSHKILPGVYLEEVKMHKTSRSTQTQKEIEECNDETRRISLETIAAAVYSLESKFEIHERRESNKYHMNSSNCNFEDLKKNSGTQTFIAYENEVNQTASLETTRDGAELHSVESQLESQERFWRSRFRAAEQQFKEQVAFIQQDLEQKIQEELNVRIQSQNSNIGENEEEDKRIDSTPSKQTQRRRERKNTNSEIDDSESISPHTPQHNKTKKNDVGTAGESKEIVMSYIQTRFTEAEEQFKTKVANLQKDLEEKMLGELNSLLQRRNSDKIKSQRSLTSTSTPIKFIPPKKTEIIKSIHNFDETESFAESLIEDDEKSSLTRGPAGQGDDYVILVSSNNNNAKSVRYKSKDDIHEYEEPKDAVKDHSEIASDYSSSDVSDVCSLSEGEVNKGNNVKSVRYMSKKENQEYEESKDASKYYSEIETDSSFNLSDICSLSEPNNGKRYEERAIDVGRHQVESQVVEKMKSLGIEEKPMTKYERNDALAKIHHDRRKLLRKEEKGIFDEAREKVKRDVQHATTSKKIVESVGKHRILKQRKNEKSLIKRLKTLKQCRPFGKAVPSGHRPKGGLFSFFKM